MGNSSGGNCPGTRSRPCLFRLRSCLVFRSHSMMGAQASRHKTAGEVGRLTVAKALTVAGSDSSGGAGIQADLKVFTALGVYGMSAITAITSQNTRGVRRIDPLTPEAVTAQMEACLEDLGVDSAKTGMLYDEGIIEAASWVLQRYRVRNLVVDPVMVAKSGHVLLKPDARRKLVERLFPLARVITPNVPEAGELAGLRVDSIESMKEAARRLADLGPEVIVIKGGHLDGPPVDLIFDGHKFFSLSGKRVVTRNTHGTGCTFSAAIAAGLALGLDVMEALRNAKRLVTWGISMALPLGSGHGPTNHFYFQMSPDWDEPSWEREDEEA